MSQTFADLLKGGLDRLVEGAKYFQSAILSLRKHDKDSYEKNLKLGAHVGISSLELLFKAYLSQDSCRSKMTPADLAKLTEPNLQVLIDLMKYADPPLDKDDFFVKQLRRYNKELYNQTKHWDKMPEFPEKPLGSGLRDALDAICNFVLRYFPRENLNLEIIDQVKDYLSATIMGGHKLDIQTVRRQFGEYFRLVDFKNYRPATDNEIQKYYEGVPLNWNIILGNGDIKRDICDDLVATYAVPPNQTRMLCLTGGPGSGKSTLAWRVACEISLLTGYPLLQVSNSFDTRFWLQLEGGAIEYIDPIIVLVDDVFGNPDTGAILDGFNPNLNIILITTSQSGELPDIFLPFIKVVKLGAPSEIEKEKVLDGVIKNINTTFNLPTTISNSNSWWVMMMEITKGEALSIIVQKTVMRMKRNAPDVYRAYEYICYFNQFDLRIPSTLLESIDSSFHNIAKNRASDQVIFLAPVTDDTGAYYTINSIFAREALKCYADHNSLRVVKEFFDILDVTNESHRSLLAIWLRKKLRTEPSKVKALMADSVSFFQKVMENSQILELDLWRQIYKIVNPKKNSELNRVILNRYPNSAKEWIVYMQVVKKYGSSTDLSGLFDKAVKWMSENTDNSGMRFALIAYIRDKGTREQKKSLLSMVETWILEPDVDTRIRVGYLHLVDEVGDQDLKNTLLVDTQNWLNLNSKNSNVRATFLSFARNNGSDELKRNIIEKYKTWLESNPDNNMVRTSFMDFVGASRYEDKKRELIDSMLQWLDIYSENEHINTKLLSLVYSWGTSRQKELAITNTLAWLDNHSDGVQVRSALLRLAEKVDESKRNAVVSAVERWLVENPSDYSVRQTYLRFVTEFGTEQQRENSIVYTREWLKGEKIVENVWGAYLKLVAKWGSPSQRADAFDDALLWLDEHSEDVNVRQSIMGHLEEFGTEDQLQKYLDQTKLWLEMHPNDTIIRSNFLGFVENYGSQEELLSLLDDLEHRLVKHIENEYALQNYLWMIVKNQNSKEILERAFSLAKKWIDGNPNTRNSLILGSYGRLLYKLEMYPDAVKTFRRVIKIHRDDEKTQILLAWSLFYCGNRKGGLAELHELEYLSKKYPKKFSLSSTYHQLGRYYFALGDYAESDKYFRLEVKESPQSYGGYWELGRVFLRRGWPRMALRVLEKADELAPENIKPEPRQELDVLIEEAKSEITRRDSNKSK